MPHLMARPEPFSDEELATVHTNKADDALIRRVLKILRDTRDVAGLRALQESENPLTRRTARHYLNTNRLYKAANGRTKRSSRSFPLSDFLPPTSASSAESQHPLLDLPHFNNCVKRYLHDHGSMPCQQISALFFDHDSPYTFVEFVHCYSKQMQGFLYEKLAEELVSFGSTYCCLAEKDESVEQKLARKHYQRILEYYIKLYSSVRVRIYRMKASICNGSQVQILEQGALSSVTSADIESLQQPGDAQPCEGKLAVLVNDAPPTPDLRELVIESKHGLQGFTSDISMNALNYFKANANINRFKLDPNRTVDCDGVPVFATATAATAANVLAASPVTVGKTEQEAEPSGIDNLSTFFASSSGYFDIREQASMNPNGCFPHELILGLIPTGECYRALTKPHSRLHTFLKKCCNVDPLRFLKVLKVYNRDGSFNHEIYNFRLNCPLTLRFAENYEGNLTYPFHIHKLDLDNLVIPILTQAVYENYINSRRIQFTSALLGHLMSHIQLSQMTQSPSRIRDYKSKIIGVKTGRDLYNENACIAFLQHIGSHFKQSLVKYAYLLKKPDTFITNGYSYTCDPSNDRSEFVDILKMRAFKKLTEMIQVFVERAIMVECNWTRESFENADAVTASTVLKFVSYNDIVFKYYKHIMALIEKYDSIATIATQDVFLSSYVPPPVEKQSIIEEAFSDESIYHPCIISSIYLLQFLKEQLGLIASSEDSYTTQLASSLFSGLESSPMFSYYYPGAQKLLIASLSSLLINLLYLFTASEPGEFRTSIYMDVTNISDTLQRLMRHFSLTSLRNSGSEIIMMGSHIYPTLTNNSSSGGSGELPTGLSAQTFGEYIDTNNFMVVPEDELDTETPASTSESDISSASSSTLPEISNSATTMQKVHRLLKIHGRVYLLKPRSIVYNEGYEILREISDDPETLYVFLILMDGALYIREISPLLLSDTIYMILLSSAIRFKGRFHQLDLVIEKLNEISHYWFTNRKMLKGLVLHQTPLGLSITGPANEFPGPTMLTDVKAHYTKLVAQLNEELSMKSSTKVIHSNNTPAPYSSYLSPISLEVLQDSNICAAGDIIMSNVLSTHLIRNRFSLNERVLVSLPYPIKITFSFINMLAGLDVEDLCRKSEKLSRATSIIDELIPFSQSAYMAPLNKFSPYYKDATILFKKVDGFDWNEKLPADLSFESLVIRAVGGTGQKKSYKVDSKSRMRLEKLALVAFKERFEPFILLLLYMNKATIKYSLGIKFVTLAVHLSFYFKHVLTICSLGRFLLPMKLKPYNRDLTTIELKVLARNATLVIYDTIQSYLQKYLMVINKFLSHVLGENLYTQVNQYLMEDLSKIETKPSEKSDKSTLEESRSAELQTDKYKSDDVSLSAPSSTLHSRSRSFFSSGGIDSGLRVFFQRQRTTMLTSKMSRQPSIGALDELADTQTSTVTNVSVCQQMDLSKMLMPSSVTLNVYFYKSRTFMKDIIDMFERKYFDQLETMEAVVCIIKYFIFQHVEQFANIDGDNKPTGIMNHVRLYEYYKKLEITDLICEHIYTSYCLGIPALCVT